MRIRHGIVSALAILTTLAALIGGCASRDNGSGKASAGGSGKIPDYNVIRLYNDTDGEVFDVELTAGATQTVLQHLPAGHSPVSDRGVSPDPATAQVRWRNADGRRLEHEVVIAKSLPPGFHGVIVLLLKDDGDVQTQFVPYSELK
jgi:hypothetical protein